MYSTNATELGGQSTMYNVIGRLRLLRQRFRNKFMNFFTLFKESNFMPQTKKEMRMNSSSINNKQTCAIEREFEN